MDRKKFYKIIDDLTEHWYIDANRPAAGIGYVRKDGSTGPRRKVNIRGEENPINETSGEVQILKWAKQEQMCLECCKMVCNKVEEINLDKGTVKCSCGLKYPVVHLVLKRAVA